jgi:hypothetical protein
MSREARGKDDARYLFTRQSLGSGWTLLVRTAARREASKFARYFVRNRNLIACATSSKLGGRKLQHHMVGHDAIIGQCGLARASRKVGLFWGFFGSSSSCTATSAIEVTPHLLPACATHHDQVPCAPPPPASACQPAISRAAIQTAWPLS